MNKKKTEKTNLEEEKGTFLLMSFVLVLSVFYVLLEWNFTPSEPELDYSDVEIFLDQELDVLSIEFPEDIAEPEIELAPEDLPFVYEDYNIVEEQELQEEKVEAITSVEQILMQKTQEQEELKISEIEKELKEDIFEKADALPEFPGGMSALIRFIYKTVKYPEVARKQKIQGRVVCSFVIEKDGSVSEVKLEKGVYSFLDDEAIRVLKLMPSWNPGLKSGEPTRIKYVLPVYFTL